MFFSILIVLLYIIIINIFISNCIYLILNWQTIRKIKKVKTLGTITFLLFLFF